MRSMRPTLWIPTTWIRWWRNLARNTTPVARAKRCCATRLPKNLRTWLADLEYVEKLQGVTMAGPHRDDLALCASGYEMRSVGSQGQCRSAAIAMRFAAVDVASQHVGKPILLLDDIFAELDVNRRDAVASLVREKDCQVLIATPQVEELPFKADKEIPLGA